MGIGEENREEHKGKLEGGVSLTQNFTKYAGLAGPPASRDLSLPLQHWDYQGTPVLALLGI